MELLTGTVSSVRHATETSGAISGSGGRVSGSVNTRHVCTLRVADVPARIKLPGATNLNDGDVVTLAGDRKADGFQGYALRNETTGTLHSYATWPGYLAGGLAVLLGIPFSLILIGIPILILGVVFLWLSVRQTRALSLLRGTPAPALGAAPSSALLK
jgi:hypothetical protein